MFLEMARTWLVRDARCKGFNKNLMILDATRNALLAFHYFRPKPVFKDIFSRSVTLAKQFIPHHMVVE